MDKKTCGKLMAGLFKNIIALAQEFDPEIKHVSAFTCDGESVNLMTFDDNDNPTLSYHFFKDGTYSEDGVYHGEVSA